MKNADLFSSLAAERQREQQPLAARCRPRTLDDFQGQYQIVGPDSSVRSWIEKGRVPSLIIWGPPGTGKTSFARILGESLPYEFLERSATALGAPEIKKLFEEIKSGQRGDKPVLLFVDEIHRLTKVQQDALLPGVEEGWVTLIGVTTENPQYAVSRALLSRAQRLVFEGLTPESLRKILLRGLARANVNLTYDEAAVAPSLDRIAGAAAGDARRALNLLELLLLSDPTALLSLERTEKVLVDLASSKALLALDDEIHYRFISDYIKAMRAGNEKVALDRLARLLAHGEDPVFIARRLIIFAAEDVGLASPHLMTYVNAVFDSCAKVGMPESRISLAAATLACCRAKKSREAYEAIAEATAALENGNSKIPV